LISNHQIDHQIAFLPLTRAHVKLCVRDYLKQQYPLKPQYNTEEMHRRVADMLHYFPEDLQLYSSSGCKRVPQKVELVLQEMEDEDEQEMMSERRRQDDKEL
jgi:hypothetical protein